MELKEHIVLHGGEVENKDDGVLGTLHRAWIDLKQALNSKKDIAILGAIKIGEKTAIEKYDKVPNSYTAHAGQLFLL